MHIHQEGTITGAVENDHVGTVRADALDIPVGGTAVEGLGGQRISHARLRPGFRHNHQPAACENLRTDRVLFFRNSSHPFSRQWIGDLVGACPIGDDNSGPVTYVPERANP